MKIETPQILWHSNADVDKGKAAPLHSCSMLPVETANNTNSNSNSGNSSSGSSSHNSSRNILATVGNTPEIHLWEVGFSRVNDKAVSAAGSAAANTAEPTKMDLTAEEAANHPSNSSTSSGKLSRILQDGSSSSSTAAASPHKHVIRHVQTLGRTIDRSLNAVKFSPDGRHLAAAGDGGVVVVYTLPRAHIPILDPTQAPAKNGRVWCEVIGNGGSETAAAGTTGTTTGGNATKSSTAATSTAPSTNDGERLLRIKALPSPSTHDVLDVSWSHDSKRLTVACLDHTLVTYENVHHDITGIADEEPKWSTVHRSTTDHCGYVQGVSMDPRGIYLASQGADRTVRVWSRKKKVIDKQIQMQLQAESSKEKADKDAAEKSSNDTAAEAKGGDGANATAADAPKDQEEQPPKAKPEPSAEEQLLARARINVVSGRAFTNGKFELNKAKIIKFRDNSCLEKKEEDKDKEGENNKDKEGQEGAGAATTAEGDAATSQPQPEKEKNVRRQHLFGDESTVESFFRRLSWTADGAYLICPAALWHCDKKESDDSGTPADGAAEGPSYATCLFSRHHFEQPARVLSGLEKPSVVVRPNPVFFKLPPGATRPKVSESEDDTAGVPSSTSLNLPYRSIFAVLTLDSVVIYDTYHTTPLAIARGLHYANLTDAVWSPDGLTLMVSSRDGYISILNFADGELGERYVPALVAAETKIVREEAAKLASRPIVPVPRAATTSTAAATPSNDTSTKAVSVTPPNTGGDAAKVTNKAGKKRVVPTLLPVGNSEINETNAMVTDAADNKIEDSTDVTGSGSGTDTAAVVTTMVAAETTTATAAEPNILQPKKKKKRVQPVLVSCD